MSARKNFVKVSSCPARTGWDRSADLLSGPDFSEDDVLRFLAAGERLQTPVKSGGAIHGLIFGVVFSLPAWFIVAILLLHFFGGSK